MISANIYELIPSNTYPIAFKKDLFLRSEVLHLCQLHLRRPLGLSAVPSPRGLQGARGGTKKPR